jgi:CPA1 family monovalent cation:H+ antiporter
LQRPHSRQQTTAFWTLATFLLNGALFVLIGLELPSAVRGLTSVELTLGFVVAEVVAMVVIGVRFGWLFTSPYVIRVLGAHPP